jgi:ribosomal protein L14E/L6E/L27E
VRHVKRVTGLYNVTIAGHPAYQQTDIAQREATDKALDAIIGEPAGLVAKREAEQAAQAEIDRQKAELKQREAELKEQQMKQEMQRRAAHLKKLSNFDQILENSIY